MLIQILYIAIVSALDMDCTNGITSSTALTSQAYKTNGQFQIVFTLTNSVTSISLTFPSLWTGGPIDPLRTTASITQCTLTSDTTVAVSPTGRVFTFTSGTDKLKTIKCVNVNTPHTNADVGDFILIAGDTTCSGIKISNFQPYTSTITISSGSTTLAPTTGQSTNTLQISWQSITMPFLFPTGSIIEITLQTNMNLKTSSTISAFSTISGVSALTQSTKTTTFLKLFTGRDFPLDSKGDIQVDPFQVMGSSQSITTYLQFRDASSNLLYELYFPALSVNVGVLTVNSLTLDTSVISAYAKYTFSITTTNPLDAAGYVRISLLQDSLAITPTATCDGTTVTPTSNLVESPQYVQVGGCLATAGTHIIAISNIKNPATTVSTLTIAYLKSYLNGQLVDQMISYVYGGTFTFGTMNAVIERTTPSSNVVAGLSYLIIKITPKNVIPTSGKLLIELPTQIVFPSASSPTCTPTCTVAAGDVLTTQATLQFTAQIPINIEFTITLGFPIRNPYDKSTTGVFKLTTTDSVGNLIDKATNVPGIVVTTESTFDGTPTFTNLSPKNGATPEFTVAVKTLTIQLLPMTLRVVFGDLQIVATPVCSVTGVTYISCTKVGTNQIDFSIGGTGTLNVGATITAVINAGAIKNKDTYQATTAFTITTLSSNAAMSTHTGVTMTNTVPGDITLPVLSVNKQYYSAVDATYTFSFTIANPLNAVNSITIQTPFTVPAITCMDATSTLLTCAQGTSSNIILISGPFNALLLNYVILVSGLPTPAETGLKTFTVQTFRTITGTSYLVDTSVAGAFVFSTSCTPANNCKTCSSDGKCTTCYDKTSTVYYYMRNGQCVSTCGLSYYQNDETITTSKYTCISCPTNCSVCSPVAGVITCSTCIQPYLLQVSSCLATCGIGYFKKQDQDITCTLCDTTCLSCQTTATTCLTCNPGVPYRNNLCYKDGCGAGYFMMTNTKSQLVCEACAENCAACSSITACLECKQLYYIFAGSCLSTCPTMYYNGPSLTCKTCIAGCDTCSDGTSCVKCTTGFYLQISTCVTKCSDGYYLDINICKPCMSYCKTCAPDETKTLICTACISGTLRLDNKTCLTTCPAGFYKSSEIACNSCFQSCSTCDKTADSCLTCVQNSETPLYLQGTQCLATCEVGYYSDATLGICQKCRSDCLTCSSDSVCLTCSQVNQPLYFFEGACKTTCPVDYYAEALQCKQSITYTSLTPTRYVPVPFTIVMAFAGLSVLVAKLHKPETFVAGSLVGLGAFIEWSSWATLGVLYYLYSGLDEYLYILMGGVGFNYLLNFTQLCLIRKWHQDPEYRRWRATQVQNRISSNSLTLLSLLSSFRILRLILSRYFGFTFFKARLVSIDELVGINLLSGVSMLFVSVPIIVASILIAYHETSFDTQIFISAIDSLIVTFFIMLFTLWETQKDQSFFDEHVANYLSLTKVGRGEDSGMFDNTLQKIVQESRQEQSMDEPISVKHGNASISVQEEVSNPQSEILKDSAKLDKFPYATPIGNSNTKHTIYFDKKQVDYQPRDQDDEEPRKVSVHSDTFSSIKSQRGEHGNNPFEQNYHSPMKGISVIDQSESMSHGESKISIFDKEQAAFNQPDESRYQGMGRSQTSQKLGQSQVSNLSILSNKSKVNNQQSNPQVQPDLGQSKVGDTHNSQLIKSEAVKSNTGIDNNSQNQQKSLKQFTENKSSKEMLQNKSALIKLQQSNNQDEQFNSHPSLEQINPTKQLSQSLIGNTRGQQQSEGMIIIQDNIDVNDPPLDVDHISNMSNNMNTIFNQQPATRAFRPRQPPNIQHVDNIVQNEPDLASLDQVEQIQLEIENLDDIPQFSKLARTLPVVPIEQGNDISDLVDAPFEEEPVQFNNLEKNKQPKPYKSKLNPTRTQDIVDKVFDSGESIHTMSDQDWASNQISPSDFNQLNQRFDHEQPIKQSKQQQQLSKAIKRPVVPIIDSKVDIAGGSSDLEQQQPMYKEFEKNYQSKQPKQKQHTEKIYLQRIERPKNFKKPMKDQRLRQLDITDAQVNNLDFNDVDF